MEFTRVRELADPMFNKIKDIQPGRSGYNIYAKVISKSVLIDIKRLDGSRVAIADFIVGDETGIIKMRLRNDEYIDMIKEDQTIIIRNCKIPVVNGHIRMIVDAFGKIEVSRDTRITEVNKEKDISAAQHDNFSMKTGMRSYDKRGNEGSSMFTGSIRKK